MRFSAIDGTERIVMCDACCAVIVDDDEGDNRRRHDAAVHPRWEEQPPPGSALSPGVPWYDALKGQTATPPDEDVIGPCPNCASEDVRYQNPEDTTVACGTCGWSGWDTDVLGMTDATDRRQP